MPDQSFTAGVSVNAITLLIWKSRLLSWPILPGKMALEQAPIRQWPRYVSYLTSFLTVLIMWIISHNRMFRHIWRSDDNFLILNGLLPAAVTIVQFPTLVLSIWFRQGGEQTSAAIQREFLCDCVFNLLWWYAVANGRLLARGYDVMQVTALTKRYRVGRCFT